MANSIGAHADEAKLRPETQDNHRARTSMMEELEAADWYDQRVAAASDAELTSSLAHSRDEEREHFVMLLEWLRRRDATCAAELAERLHRRGSIVDHEQTGTAGGGASADGAGSLGPGSLKGGNSL